MPPRPIPGGRVRLRRATLRDAPGLLACLHAAFAQYQGDYTAAAYEDTTLTQTAVLDRLARMRVVVAVDSVGAVIGTLATERRSRAEGHLRGMAVVPEYQGTGVAAALLRDALRQLTRDGCERVTLDTTRPLERAVRFYEKNGFHRSGGVGDLFGMPLFEFVRPLRSDDDRSGR
jgi:GNAT superfamily N-acetyltransferase